VRNARSALVLVAVALGILATARWGLQAQDQERKGEASGPTARPKAISIKETDVVAPDFENAADRPVSVQEALQRPFVMPFGQPTSLNEVARHLRMILKAPVVLDRAALKRQELTPEDMVQLDLRGVRLKTGLKLLLDQVDLTFKVVPEDNLLIITDDEGSEDPLDRVLTEIKALRLDVRDVQDSLDEIRSALGLDEEEGPKLRKPTIIEDMPEEGGKKPSTPRPRPGI
jgi:hypothetical protein